MGNIIQKRLGDLMKVRDLSELSLSKQAGVSQSTISRILHGKASPTHRVLLKIATAMHIPVEALTVKNNVLALIIADLSALSPAEIGRFYDLIQKELLWNRQNRPNNGHTPARPSSTRPHEA